MEIKIEKPEDKNDVWLIKPLPGYVCKWKDVKIGGIGGEELRKCFVNVCHCEQLPPPMVDLDEEEIAKLFDQSDNSYKIPMSVGELDCVKDRKEENSMKIDILVNTTFYNKRLSSHDDTFFRHLLCLIFCDIIKSKHSIDLDPMSTIILRNRVSVGELEVQKIMKRPESKIVQEVSEDDVKEQKKLDEKQPKGIQEEKVIQDVKDEMLGVRRIEGVSVRLFDGKRLEISMRSELNGTVINDPRRLSLKLNPTRCLVIVDRSQSMFDFHLPMHIDPTTAKSKFIHEKSKLVISADIVLVR